MVKIHARQPQVIARQRIQIAPGQPFGKPHPADGDHALQHAGIALPRLIPRVTNRYRAGYVSGAIHVLRARIHQQQFVLQHGTVRPFGHPVVHDGPVWPRPADRIERDIVQRVGRPSKPFQGGHHINFRQTALRCAGIKPTKEFHHRSTIAQMCFAGGSDFRCVLAGFGQAAGVCPPCHRNACSGQRLAHRQRRG